MANRGDSTVERQHARLLALNNEVAALKARLSDERIARKTAANEAAALRRDSVQRERELSRMRAIAERTLAEHNKLSADLDTAKQALAEIHALSK